MPGDSQYCPKCGRPVGAREPNLDRPESQPSLTGLDSNQAVADWPFRTGAADFVSSPRPMPRSLTYAGWGRRLIACLIDASICVVFIIASAALFRISALISLTMIAGPWLYFALFESSAYQATPGKRALGIQVLGVEGRRLSFWRATGRFWVKGLSMGITFCLASLVGLFTEKVQTLHDLAVDSIVVRTA